MHEKSLNIRIVEEKIRLDIDSAEKSEFINECRFEEGCRLVTDEMSVLNLVMNPGEVIIVDWQKSVDVARYRIASKRSVENKFGMQGYLVEYGNHKFYLGTFDIWNFTKRFV